MANGTIAFDTLTTSDSVNTNTEKSIDTSYIFNGVAKQWINLNGNANSFIRDSFNTTTFTDNGTGDYSISITNAMINSTYSLAGISGDGTTAFNRGLSTGYGTDPTTNLYRLVAITASSGAATNCFYVSCQLNGELA